MLRKRKKKSPLVPGAPITFRTLDEARGEFLEGDLPRDWALEIWFADLYDVPFEGFSDFDLARSCRQYRALDTYMEPIVDRCLEIMRNATMEWWQYDSDTILYPMVGLPHAYWSMHAKQYEATLAFVRHFLGYYEEKDEYRDKIAQFLSNAGTST